MGRQAEMFAKPSAPRVVRAHVVDAGNGPGPGHWCKFMCSKCGWHSEWQHVENVTEGKRGVPCPVCNALARARGEQETESKNG